METVSRGQPSLTDDIVVTLLLKPHSAINWTRFFPWENISFKIAERD